MGTWKQLLNCWQTIPRMALFEILLAIAMFTGKSETATCEQKIVADLPSLSKIREFGKIYSIEMPSSSPFSNGTCSWEFSSPENYLLNLYFINITSPQKSSGSDCSGNYFLIKSSDSGRSTLDVSQQFCWQRALPRLRVNGTVTVELHYNQNTVKGAGLSMAVSVEASSPGCGGVFNDSSNYVPASFDSQTFGNGSTNSPIHCVWYFHFMAPQEMNILVSHFDFPHDFNPECTSIRKFIELRSFNESTGMTIQRSRKCARSNYALPENFKIQTSKSFVVTVHSEGASSTRERILTACLPTSPGASREYFSVDDIQNQTLHELTRASNPKENVRGLILLKPERSADQLFTFINNISRICSEGKLQIWSTKANIFKLDTQICSSALSGSTFLNSNVTIAINYEARQEAIEETEVSFFASNKDPVKMTTRLPSTTATTSVSTTLRTSKNTTSIQTTNCCSTVDKKTTQTQSKNRKSTKASQLFSTIQTKKSVSAKAKKSVASNENLYIATITVGAVIMLCMGFLILAILRRRKRSHQTEKENSDQVERSKKRKRQNSAMPLVSMDDARKTSLANNALDGIIENIAYAEMNIPSKEMENPYYRASDHRHAKINPCYASNTETQLSSQYNDSGTIEEEAEYATANEQHIYSDVLSKTSPDGYSYAQNPATTKTDVSQDSGSKEGDENPYESTDYGYVI
ncbi:uncharacterized protein LOC135692233 isoform X4 [Rhopilema esculentum]|uniref:uncharacterized protein LOC135692233 isoform X4 n=1 Tax=Rhopilema esculentum TaxID=499914 RepID=UPI0031D4B248